MNCKNICSLCNNLIFSTAINFDPTTNSLDITIPNNGYRNCQKVCIVVAQTIPAATTINALVNIVVNGTRFPLQRWDCTQAVATEIRTRTKYSTRVVTNTVSGAFRLLGRTYACCPESLQTLPIPTTTPTTPTTLTTRTTRATASKKEAVANE